MTRSRPIRIRLMLGLTYNSALRRDELFSLRTDDLDPAHRMMRVRTETTKTRLGRVVLYSAATVSAAVGLPRHRAGISHALGRCSCPGHGAITVKCPKRKYSIGR